MKGLKFSGKSDIFIGDAVVFIIDEQTSEAEDPMPTEDDLIKI
jgi:hypothetical protein